MTTNMDEDVEVQEQILYDLSVHCEWQLDSETVVSNRYHFLVVTFKCVLTLV